MDRVNHIRSINYKLWIGLLISGLFLYLSVRKVDLYRTWAIILSSDLPLLTLVVLVSFLQYVLRAFRWYFLLEAIKKTGFSNRLASSLIGFAANCILPARLGEFVRANYLGLMEKISRSSVFGTIVTERIFDGLTLLMVLWIGFLGTKFPEELNSVAGSLRAMGFSLLLIYILVIVFLVGFKHSTSLFINILEKLLFFLSQNLQLRIIDVMKKFALGLVPIQNGYGWFIITFYSLTIWFLSLCQIKLISYSIGVSVPFMAAFLILAMASLGVMIPSAPGFIGTFHLVVQYGFLLHGVAREEALSAAVLWHAAFFFPTIFFGAIAFLWVKIPWVKVSQSPS